MALSKKPYKGTRDFLPDDKRIQDYLFDKMHKTAHLFGYEHYDGPLLEEVELYKAKSGEELINDQIYSFKDRGDRFVAIRPEMTPTVARMVAKIHKEVAKPIRWYSIPNLLRYERPQRGRLREHWQFNCDVFGGPGRLGEAEIIQLIIFFLESFGANEDHFEVLVNDRTIVDTIFAEISPDEKTTYKLYKLVDKSKKIPKEALEKELNELTLKDNGSELFQEYLNLKSFEDLKSLLTKIGKSEVAEDFHQFVTETIPQDKLVYLQYDPTIVRGLDYYTGIVFEVFDKHPDNRRAICGGGAYANLLQIFNESPLGGVGFGLGDVTLQDFLTSHNLLPDLSKPNNDLLITFQTEQGLKDLSQLANELRKKGIKTVTNLEELKFKKVFSLAEKKGASFVTLYGDDEKAKGEVSLKNLKTKEQENFKISDSEAIFTFLNQ
jgi:histidyl-tRNA synthetase